MVFFCHYLLFLFPVPSCLLSSSASYGPAKAKAHRRGNQVMWPGPCWGSCLLGAPAQDSSLLGPQGALSVLRQP